MWCKDAIKLFQEYDHKRNELISKGVDTFAEEDINNFIWKLDDFFKKVLKKIKMILRHIMLTMN